VQVITGMHPSEINSFKFHISEIMQYFLFCVQFTSLNIMISSSIHVFTNDKISFFSWLTRHKMVVSISWLL
jgi:hypothetical protein